MRQTGGQRQARERAGERISLWMRKLSRFFASAMPAVACRLAHLSDSASARNGTPLIERAFRQSVYQRADRVRLFLTHFTRAHRRCRRTYLRFA